MVLSRKDRWPELRRDHHLHFYWTHWNEVAADGVLKIKTSWWMEDGSHTSGYTKVAPGEPDYGLWQWIIQQRKAGLAKFDEIVSSELLDILRADLMYAHQKEQDVVVGEGGGEEHRVNAV